ncbi:MAG: conjugal transfer pilus assembly protein TraB [Candidatus Accumulibacter regalis]|uniref:Conjugal transfer pilus assembly protein TraB n=1 Tax=Accumulibacter regalis TaxID=522306 RepID=A0A011PA79_ACCRE|nr:MAG: conjugal transfer pilus assembly protein TraB [Candidatus Accumulibacter regalis]
MAESPGNRIASTIARLSPKQRQLLILGLGGSVFTLLIFGGVALWDQPTTLPEGTPPVRPHPLPISAPGAQADPRDIWMSKSSEQMRQMEEMIQGLRQQVDLIERQPPLSNPVVQALPPQPLPSPPPPVIEPLNLPPMPPLPPLPANPGAGMYPDGTPMLPRLPGIATFEVSDAKVSAPAVGGQGVDQKDARSYVPSGSFFRAVLLGGLDAPTGGQAQSNPHPVLMRVQDNAFLPNRYRFKIKECFALGASYGDISAERAYIRLESLSCVRRDGKAIDVPVKGYVVGEDGKAGMRGRLISKQGQVLANALLAGIGAGIGQAFQQSAMTVSTSPLGSIGSVDPGKQVQAGLGTGVGKALDRLSQYYITLAEKMFPIIEIDAGRTVEVVFTKGFSLAGGSAGGGDADSYTDIWRRGREVQKKPLEPFKE